MPARQVPDMQACADMRRRFRDVGRMRSTGARLWWRRAQGLQVSGGRSSVPGAASWPAFQHRLRCTASCTATASRPPCHRSIPTVPHGERMR